MQSFCNTSIIKVHTIELRNQNYLSLANRLTTMVTYNIKRVPCRIIIWQEGYLFNSWSQICQNLYHFRNSYHLCYHPNCADFYVLPRDWVYHFSRRHVKACLFLLSFVPLYTIILLYKIPKNKPLAFAVLLHV